MNKYLEEQVKKYIPDLAAVPEQVRLLLDEIAVVYDQFYKADKGETPEEANERRTLHLQESQHIAKIGSWEVELDAQDPNNSKYFWSDEAYRIFGYEPRSIAISRDVFYNHVPEEERPVLQAAMREAIETNGTFKLEHHLTMPDGQLKPVYQRAKVVHTENGRPVRIIGTMQDITERKKAREELEKTNSELQTLLNNMREAFFTVDLLTGRVIQMTPACVQIYGYTPGEFKNNSDLWLSLIVEEDKEQASARMAAVITGSPCEITYRIKHKDGSIRWLESKLRPSQDETGKTVRLDGFTADITERKEAEIALQQSESKFRSLIVNSSDIIVLTNEALKNVFVSDSVQRITGFTPKEVMDKISFSLAHPDDAEKTRSFLQEVLEKPGETLRTEYRTQKKDGTYIWCERTSTNLLHDPVINGIVTSLRDITNRTRNQQALEVSNAELKKSNMELDKFVYSVSHDLRAPLASIMGIIDLSEMESGEEQLREILGMVKSSAIKLDGFIRDILDYSRNARTDVKYREVNFEEMLNDITGNLRFMGGSYNVDMNISVEANAVFRSDKNRVNIILSNLISNALRYHNPDVDNPYVNIEVQVNGTQALITVADNGVGISETAKPKVFDMFYRGSVHSVGSGLGLYIVKEAVDKLDGTIDFASQEGKGTTFRLSLPNMPPQEI